MDVTIRNISIPQRDDDSDEPNAYTCEVDWGNGIVYDFYVGDLGPVDRDVTRDADGNLALADGRFVEVDAEGDPVVIASGRDRGRWLLTNGESMPPASFYGGLFKAIETPRDIGAVVEHVVRVHIRQMLRVQARDGALPAGLDRDGVTRKRSASISDRQFTVTDGR